MITNCFKLSLKFNFKLTTVTPIQNLQTLTEAQKK